MLNCYATNYFNNFNLLKILHLVYFLFRTMMITKINEKVLLDFRQPRTNKENEDKGRSRKNVRYKNVCMNAYNIVAIASSNERTPAAQRRHANNRCTSLVHQAQDIYSMLYAFNVRTRWYDTSVDMQSLVFRLFSLLKMSSSLLFRGS